MRNVNRESEITIGPESRRTWRGWNRGREWPLTNPWSRRAWRARAARLEATPLDREKRVE